ncbi:MAG: Nre family DNA repair protein [Candidatus Nitrosocaldus sp.]
MYNRYISSQSQSQSQSQPSQHPSSLTLFPLPLLQPIHSTLNPSLCIQCRGSKYLCGLAYCPIIVSSVKTMLERSVDKSIDGYTPPSVFVGRLGYPKVSIGPMISLVENECSASISMYDCPEQWHDITLDDILKFRLAMVRGKVRVHVDDAAPTKSNRLTSIIQELAMAKLQVYAEMLLKHRPSGISLSEYLPPSGPSAEVERLNVGNVRVDDRIEKAYYDDLSAGEAMVQLYSKGISISSIVRALSAGCLGYKSRRRFVPTRWSITAVDDTISRALIERIRYEPSIDEYIVYSREVSMNRFVCILMPGTWEFEWIEAWFPNTVWNAYGSSYEMMGDHEGYRGRKEYARVGGCYYSARLAVSEHLASMKRQARVLMLREIYQGFNIPVGVWFVREHVRAMLKSNGARFTSIDDAIKYAMSILKIPLKEWVRGSHMLRDMKGYQTRLLDYTAEQT